MPLTKTYSIRFLTPLLTLCLTSAITILLVVTFFTLPNFLSPENPLNGDFLIVEGWIPDYALEKAAAIFTGGDYQKVIVTGCEIEIGSFLSEYKTYASIGATSLKKIGIPESNIIVLPSIGVIRNRTLSCAVEVKKWLDSCGYNSGIIDICTLGPHGRRTWHLYKKALGKSINSGIFSLNVKDYDENRWFLSSEGFRQNTSELIALVYALLFSP